MELRHHGYVLLNLIVESGNPEVVHVRNHKVVEKFGAQLFLDEVGHVMQVQIVIAHLGSGSDLDGGLVAKPIPKSIRR